ncbi:MAG: hypothetical protein PHV52_00225 [Aliarcobacter sp.]|nr:hypothetical protein [Aliarcobacter sp.]
MSGLKLNYSIFDTTTGKDSDLDFSGIVKDTTVTNSSNSDIADISGSTALKNTTSNPSSFWEGIKSSFGGEETTTTDDGMFSGANIGSTLKGGGAVVGALAGIYGTLEQTKFNKEVLGMEKDRINRNIKREDQLQKNYEGVWSKN